MSQHSFTPSAKPGVPASRPDRLRGSSGHPLLRQAVRGSAPGPLLRTCPRGLPARAICLWPRSLGQQGGWRPDLPLRLGDVATTQLHRERHDFKASVAHAPNVTLLLHAPAVDLATDEDPDRVDRVQVRRADGSSCFVWARLIVLAAGGIENQRMLRHRACRSGNARSCPPNRRWPRRWSSVRSRPGSSRVGRRR